MAKTAHQTNLAEQIADKHDQDKESTLSTSVTEMSQTEKDKLLKEHKTWSGVFRALAALGKSKGEIAKMTGKRYQHVRNVLITPLTGQKPQGGGEKAA
jgi:hypothetical protein